MSKDEKPDAAVGQSAATSQDAKPAQPMVLARSAIVRSRTNPRTHFDESYIKELAASIAEHGVIQPILVRPLPGSRLQDTFDDRAKGAPLPTHEIVCGECRFRAAGIAAVDELPVLVRHLDDIQVLQIQLVENLKRRDLHPLEEAEGFERLVKDHSLTIEDVAARIGKSASYVYKLMKLLDLTPECREILYQGKLSQSTALLVARAPAYLQQQIAKDIMDGGDGEPMSYRRAQDHIHRRYMLRLSDAPFDIKDASLVTKAGACTGCAKNTGSNSDLFGDAGGADSCTDPKCFDSKKVAHMDALAKRAKAQGKTVITGKEAKGLYPHEHSAPKGYTRLDEPQYVNGSYQPLRKALGKDLPSTTLIQNPFTKQLEEVLPNAVANKLIKQVDEKKKAATAVQKKDAEPTKAALEQAARERFEDRAVEALHAAIMAGKSKGITVPLAREIAKYYSQTLYGESANRFARLFDLNAIKVATSAGIDDFLDTCPDSMVGPALLIMIIETDLEQYDEDKSRSTMEIIAKDAGVDLAKVRDEVKAEMKAAAEARKAEAQGANAGRPPKAKAAPKKTTAADAKAGISKALKQAAKDQDDKKIPLKNGAMLDPQAAWPFPTAAKPAKSGAAA
jgi:ParB/RepB/Spo0J family partition protein